MKHDTPTPKHSELSGTFNGSTRPALRLDTAKYQHMLDDRDLSPAQKEQVLKALWEIIVAFVELGFSVEPLEESCGKLFNRGALGAEEGNSALGYDPHERGQT